MGSIVCMGEVLLSGLKEVDHKIFSKGHALLVKPDGRMTWSSKTQGGRSETKWSRYPIKAYSGMFSMLKQKVLRIGYGGR